MYFNVRNIVSVYIVFGITIDNSTCLDMLVESRDLTLGLDLKLLTFTHSIVISISLSYRLYLENIVALVFIV